MGKLIKQFCLLALLTLTTLFTVCGCQVRPDAPVAPIDYPDIVDLATDTLETVDGTVIINEDTIIDKGLLREMREYAFPDGDTFYQERFSLAAQKVEVDPSIASSDSVVSLQQVTTFSLSGESGTIRYYDYDAEQWLEEPLEEGVYTSGQYFIDIPGRCVILVLPKAYQSRENQMLEALPEQDGLMDISRGNGNFLITIYIPHAVDKVQYEYMYLRSTKPLIDWDNEYNQHRWAGYLFDGDNRWCWDGYYYIAPENYIPSGANYYHRLPAAYIASNMAYYDNRAAKSLCLAMLDIMLDLQNEQGYFPTYAGSQWLLDDYEIGPGFYDTRFNSDLIHALATAAEKYQVPRFVDAVAKYGKFYLTMASENHHTVTDDNGGLGWLVYDYWHPEYFLPNHTSLNHQAAEIINLFLLARISGNSEYIQVAQYMVNGITMLGNRWVKSNHDLYYAYMGNGQMGRADYPYLTYNDLYDLQEVLEENFGTRDSGLQKLMEQKKMWMDANRITGYKQ